MGNIVLDNVHIGILFVVSACLICIFLVLCTRCTSCVREEEYDESYELKEKQELDAARRRKYVMEHFVVKVVVGTKGDHSQLILSSSTQSEQKQMQRDRSLSLDEVVVETGMQQATSSSDSTDDIEIQASQSSLTEKKVVQYEYDTGKESDDLPKDEDGPKSASKERRMELNTIENRGPPSQPSSVVLNQNVKVESLTASSCTICLCSYENGERICLSANTECAHIFHEECLVQWLLKNDDCPICRKCYFDRTNDHVEDKEEQVS